VRELKNIVERLMIMTRANEVTANDVRNTLTVEPPRTDPSAGLFETTDYRDARAAFERAFLLRKLEEFGWNVTRTAEAVSIERSNLHRKIKALGIELPRGVSD